MATDINLLKLSPLPESLMRVEARLRSLSIATAFVLIGLGVLAGVGKLIFSSQVQRLQDEKSVLVSSIASQGQKEAVFVAVQSRTAVVEKVLAQTASWAQVIDMIRGIAVNGTLNTVQVDEKRVTLSADMPSLESTIAMVREVRALVHEGRVTQPVLESLQLNEDGSVAVRTSFLIKFL